MQDTACQVIKAAKEFYSGLYKDKNGRYRSWEYCYYNFYKARTANKPDTDYLSLQLAFYLASWGMYRGSSFLLQKDYKIHIPVVEKLLDSKYDELFGVSCEKLQTREVQMLLLEIVDFLSQYYQGVRATVKGKNLKNSISMTLVTKILMGTLGCVPAYDRYFIAGVKSKKVCTANFNLKSVLQLAKFYLDNRDIFEAARKEFPLNDIIYPPMKLIDMGFWVLGSEGEI